ncbi:MAG: hypothetical protein EH225_13350, partial [Calditrichaeota bacterium]
MIRDWIDRKVRIVRREEELNQGFKTEVNYHDFMILLRYKSGMDIYSRVLTEHGIPVTVSGYASLNQSRNIRELLKLLRLLRDPENEVLLVAVLRGIFYGLSDEEIYQFKEAGGKFDFSSDIPANLENGLKQRIQKIFAQLRAYYSWSSELLPVIALEKIMVQSGLQPYTCGGISENEQGNEIYFILEHLRKSEMQDFYHFAGMVEILEKIWESGIEEEFDLEGEENTVRIMNLHKAKGLESPVVFLAIPYNSNRPGPDHHIERLTEIPRGHFLVQQTNSYGRGKIIAQPQKWKEYCQIETSYLQAEETRLLYVAATRAKNLLVVSSFGQHSSENKQNPWKALLRDFQPEMTLEMPDQKKIEKQNRRETYTIEEFEKQKEEMNNWQKQAVAACYKEKTPSHLKFSAREEFQPVLTIYQGGIHWGNAVHQVLEFLVSKQPSEGLLLSYIISSLEKNLISVDRKDELIQIVQTFQRSELFRRLLESPEKLTEVPFNLKINSTDPLYREFIN